MKTEEIFSILGIEVSKDELRIQNAYREKLKVTNPEDDSEGFMRLRKAYEEACAYARKKEEEEPLEEKDETRSGKWVEKAAELYADFRLRCSEEAWKELFHDEVFLSLEENEECRKKLLIFMMNHFCFPFKIWQLFDHKLNICKDSTRLKEFFPPDYIQFLVRRCREEESIDYELFTGPNDGDYDLFLKLYRSAWEALQKKNAEEAERIYQEALQTGISHPYMEFVKVHICKETGKEEEAKSIIEKLYKDYPEDAWILYQIAEYYWERGKRQQAIPHYQHLKEINDKHYMANYRLAVYYCDQQELIMAESCLSQIPHGAYDVELREVQRKVYEQKKPLLQKKWEEQKDVGAAIELAACLFEEEAFFAAGNLLEKLEGKVEESQKEKYYQLLGRAYIGQAENDKAIEVLKQCRENTVYITKLKIAAYHAMGRGFVKYLERAIEEFERIKGEANEDVQLLMEMAQVFLDKKEYQKCLEIAQTLLDTYQIQYAWVLMTKSYAGLRNGGGVIRCGNQSIQYFPNYAYPYEEIARVYHQTGHPDELKELLERARENKIESIYLEDYEYYGEEIPEGFNINEEAKSFDSFYYSKLVQTANYKLYEYGYPVITKLLKMYPCYALLIKRGLFSMAAKENEAAMKDFRKVLEDDPANAFAHNNIGCLYKYTEQYEKALTCFNKAIYYMYRESSPEPIVVHYGNLAHTYELLGEYARAVKVYQRMYDEFKHAIDTIRNLCSNYARIGKTEEARVLVEPLYANNDQHEKQFLLHRIYLYAAQWDKAERYSEGYRKSLNHYGASDMTTACMSKYYHMKAWHLLLKGQLSRALSVLNEAIENSKTPSSRKKEKLDVLLNKLFFLTIEEQKGNMPGQKALKSEIASFWKKALGVFGSAKEMKSGTFTSKTFTDERSVEDVQMKRQKAQEECLQELEKTLDQFCRKQLNNKEPRNLAATEYFFYKERYVGFINFILALYKEGVFAGEKAFQQMEESPRCRLCNHGCCMRLRIAKALLLEKQGKNEEALEVYRQLAKEQPYNTYARTKLIFAGEDM